MVAEERARLRALAPEAVMFAHFTESLDNAARGRWWTALTSAFSHRDAAHLLANMVVALSVAPPVLDALGVSSPVAGVQRLDAGEQATIPLRFDAARLAKANEVEVEAH